MQDSTINSSNCELQTYCQWPAGYGLLSGLLWPPVTAATSLCHHDDVSRRRKLLNPGTKWHRRPDHSPETSVERKQGVWTRWAHSDTVWSSVLNTHTHMQTHTHTRSATDRPGWICSCHTDTAFCFH